ncbi:MAG: hypothetical protein P8Y63_14750 [Deltaproteobacteria bacterium]
MAVLQHSNDTWLTIGLSRKNGCHLSSLVSRFLTFAKKHEVLPADYREIEPFLHQFANSTRCPAKHAFEALRLTFLWFRPKRLPFL